MSGLRFFEIPKSEIQLGALPAFEYQMLRLALQYAVRHAISQASDSALQKEQRNTLLDQVGEFRALQRRFIKAGRRGVS